MNRLRVARAALVTAGLLVAGPVGVACGVVWEQLDRALGGAR